MRFIEELRDTHEGEEIWIVGPGPSLDDYPLNFFNDKTSIAMRPCGIIFPNCTYNFCSYDDRILEPYFKKNLHLLKKQIFTLNPKPRKNWLGEYNEWPIFMRTLKWYSFGYRKKQAVDRKYVEQTVKEIMEKRSTHYASMGLIQGWTIEAALVLGAKKITLAGCEGQVTKHKYHAQRLDFFYKPWMDRINLSPSKNGFSRQQLEKLERTCLYQRLEVQWLAEMLKPYNIELVNYPSLTEGACSSKLLGGWLTW